jgi:hypothetical protein
LVVVAAVRRRQATVVIIVVVIAGIPLRPAAIVIVIAHASAEAAISIATFVATHRVSHGGASKPTPDGVRPMPSPRAP